MQKQSKNWPGVQYPLKWDRTGTVVEVRQFDQYVVRVDGSGRVTIRNRKFLRKYHPVQTPPPRLTVDHDIGIHRPVIPQTVRSPSATMSKVTPTHKEATQGPLKTPVNPPPSTNPTPQPPKLTSPTPPPDAVVTPAQQLSPAQPPDSQPVNPCPPPDPDPPPPASVDVPAATPRRSGRSSRKPAWHSDYDM